jgi:hypothetical protein
MKIPDLFPVRVSPEGHFIACAEGTIYAHIFSYEESDVDVLPETLARALRRNLKNLGAKKANITVVISEIEK